MTRRIGIAIVVLCLTCGFAFAQPDRAATPAPLVETYESLADMMLAANKTEWNLVHSILASTYRHAESVMADAKAELEAGRDARSELETLASLVAQLGNEGDAAVAAVRKRLLEGGHHHHHHSSADEENEYDEGFVIVTRAAKKVFLDAAGRIAKTTSAANLNREWKTVAGEFGKLHKATGTGH